MSRAEQGKTLAIASLAFAGAAGGSLYSKGGWDWSAMIAMAVSLAVALLGLVYARKAEDAAEKARKLKEDAKEERQRKELESERQERLDAETKNHEIFLNERVECEGGLCGPPGTPYKFPRRQLWRLPPPLGTAACSKCYQHRTGHKPSNDTAKRAFE